jgi:hypothetical protein
LELIFNFQNLSLAVRALHCVVLRKVDERLSAFDQG